VNDADVASGKPIPVQLRGSDGTDRSNALPVSQSGTWTVQPGNTANTTAWKVDGSAVTQPVSGTVGISGTIAITANSAVNVAQINGVTPLMGNGVTGTGSQRVTIASDNTAFAVNAVQSGTWNTNALPAGTSTIGDVGFAARATGGLTIGRVISAASTNATSIKASAGRLHTIAAFNVNAAARYLKIYNKASAPTVGSDTPVLTFAIPGNTAAAGFTIDSSIGWALSTGIAIALTTGITDADTGAVAASEIAVNLGYA
jgi:hypothetical protein